MPDGAVVVDISIDQGGSIETARTTSHAQPTYVEEGAVHCCLPNLPARVGRTATAALTSVTLPWAQRAAREGIDSLLGSSPSWRSAANVIDGRVTHPAVARAFDLDPADPPGG